LPIKSKRLKKIKLIVLDLDGTVLTDEGFIGQNTLNSIHKLQDEYGVAFSVATGRLQSSINEYCKALKINVPIISLDGSLIKKLDDDKPVFEAYVNKKHVKKAVELADRFMVRVALCHADHIYYTENNELIPSIANKMGAKYSIVDSYDDVSDTVLEIFMASENHSYVRYISNKMSFPYSFGLNYSLYKAQTQKGIYYLEIRKKGCNKKTGLSKLIRHLGVSINQCAVIGDWYNDRPLFETKALKIAMANSVPEIKYLSDYVAEADNNNNGVAEFLEMVLKAKMDK
jgi:Cof subfamily protein (haloacid dehalogenase superfamily)